MLAKTKDVSLMDNLKIRFLYLNDLNSANLLINLYQSQENLNSLYPQYSSKSDLRKYIKRNMRGKPGSDLAAGNLANLIHSDINRFELLMYLDGYKAGFHAHRQANRLEEILLSSLEVPDLYDDVRLNDFCDKNKEILDYKRGVLAFVGKDAFGQARQRRAITDYSKRIIKPKVLSLNNYIDVQLSLDCSNLKQVQLKQEPRPFSRRDLNILYRKISTMVFKKAVDIYISAYWKGIIEKVKIRYK